MRAFLLSSALSEQFFRYSPPVLPRFFAPIYLPLSLSIRVMGVPRRILTSSRATHFLGLPLYNSKSKSQLESFTHRMRNDEYAESIPKRDFRMPQSFHVPVAQFKLDAERDVEVASEVLHRLDVQRMLQDAAAPTAKVVDPLNQEDRETETCGTVPLQVSPLQVSLAGIQRAGTSPLLYGKIYDPSDRLRNFNIGVRREFYSAGIRHYLGLSDNGEDLYEDEGSLENKPRRCELLSPRTRREVQTFLSREGHMVTKRRLVPFDITPLFQRYENAEMAKDIVIEKLGLFQKSCKRTFAGERNEDLVDEYYEEVDSIPLPWET